MAVIRFPPNQSFKMKPHVIRFADDMEAYFGGAMNWGTYAGHSPPEGPTQALDHFNPNSPAGHRQQDKAAEWAIRNARKYGLRYVIKRYEIWNIERAAEGWRPRKRTGNPTVDHLDHNHYTFYAVAAGIDDRPSKPVPELVPQEEDEVRIINVKDRGIFLLRGDKTQGITSPDHVTTLKRCLPGIIHSEGAAEVPAEIFDQYLAKDSDS